MPDMTMDPYVTLKLPHGSSIDDVRRQYRRLARIYHPDRNPGDKEWCEEQLKDLNAAFNLLSDPAKKAAIDTGSRTGAAGSSDEPETAANAGARRSPAGGSFRAASASQQQEKPRNNGAGQSPTGDAAGKRPAEPFSAPRPEAVSPSPRRASRRPGGPVLAVIAASAVGIIAYGIVYPRPKTPPMHAAPGAAARRHPIHSAHSVISLSPPAGSAGEGLTGRPHAHRKIAAAHPIVRTTRHAKIVTVAHAAVKHHVTVAHAAVKHHAIATHPAMARRQKAAPVTLHGDQGAAVALRLAEQAEARGRAVEARRLKRLGISAGGMNLSQMRRAADRAQ